MKFETEYICDKTFSKDDSFYIADCCYLIETLAGIISELTDGEILDEQNREALCDLLPDVLDRIGIIVSDESDPKNQEDVKPAHDSITAEQIFPYVGGSVHYNAKENYKKDLDFLKGLRFVDIETKKALADELTRAYNECSSEDYKSWLVQINKIILEAYPIENGIQKRLNDFIYFMWDYVDYDTRNPYPSDEYYLSEDSANLLNEVCREVQKVFEPVFKAGDCVNPDEIDRLFDNGLVWEILGGLNKRSV